MYLYETTQPPAPTLLGLGATPWPLSHSWTDRTAAGSGPTYREAYHDWIAANYDRFNDEKYLCNWYPLRLLTEFASAEELRLKLRYWPGSASTTGGERSWDTSRVFTHDSHGGEFDEMLAYYFKVASTVTARMIGTLNTVSIERSQIRPGDLLITPHSDAYWHAEVVTSASSTEIVAESGTTPKRVPKRRVRTSLEGSLLDGKASRWAFAQFE